MPAACQHEGAGQRGGARADHGDGLGTLRSLTFRSMLPVRSNIPFGICVELFAARRRAEVIAFILIVGLRGGGLVADLHATDWILERFLLSSFTFHCCLPPFIAHNNAAFAATSSWSGRYYPLGRGLSSQRRWPVTLAPPCHAWACRDHGRLREHRSQNGSSGRRLLPQHEVLQFVHRLFPLAIKPSTNDIL